MTNPRPAIAILTPFTFADFGVWHQHAALLPDGYPTAVNRAGGLALLVTPDSQLTADPDEVLDRVDGLMLSGGADIDPALQIVLCAGAPDTPEIEQQMAAGVAAASAARDGRD